MQVKDVMNQSVVSVASNATAARVIAQSQMCRLTVPDGKVVGILSLGDFSVRHTCDMGIIQALCCISNNSTEN